MYVYCAEGEADWTYLEYLMMPQGKFHLRSYRFGLFDLRQSGVNGRHSWISAQNFYGK